VTSQIYVFVDVDCHVRAEQASYESVHNGRLAADGERVDTSARFVGSSGRLRPRQVDARYDWRFLSYFTPYLHCFVKFYFRFVISRLKMIFSSYLRVRCGLCEGPYRMRKKLVRNFLFYQHYPYKPSSADLSTVSHLLLRLCSVC